MLKYGLFFVLVLSLVTNNGFAQSIGTTFSSDLSRLEQVNFGKTFELESFDERLTRLETALYNKQYQDKTISQRLNNLINKTNEDEKFRNNDQESNEILTEKKYNKKVSLIDKIKNNIIGEPTGYTPQVRDYSDFNAIGPSYMQGFYGNSGWNNHNNYIPPIRMSF